MRLLLLYAGLVVASLCWAAGRDHKAPEVRITAPTTASTYLTTRPDVLVLGTAQDRKGQVVEVRWQTAQGQAGTAQGTTQWRVPLTLLPGTTRLTVTAVDTAGLTGQAVLTLVLTPAVLPTITVLWSWPGGGEVFQLERCVLGEAGCAMTPQQTVAIDVRQWTDTAVQADLEYCYRIAVLSGSVHGPYSNTLCTR